MCQECEEIREEVNEKEIIHDEVELCGKERKMFWEVLPRKNGKCNKVDWSLSVKDLVEFAYEGIQGTVEIVGYETKGQYLWIKYLDKEPFKINTGNFVKCSLGKLLGKITGEFKIEIGTMFKDDKRDLIITGKEYRIDKGNIERKWYKYSCSKCGWGEGWIEESQILNNGGCGCCCQSNKTIVEHINSIVSNEETKWMIPYFQGGYDEAKLYAPQSNQKLYFKCPDCGRIKEKEMSISTIFNERSIGCSCSDNYKYPEKLMYSVLEQLGIDFTTQLNKTTFKWCKNYRYDFYINDINAILETHGAQHYKEACGKFKKTLTEEIENDRLKYELALNNGIKKDKYMVIDCKKSELEWIENSILNSKLNDLFDLSIIDWNKAEEYALSNLVKNACKIKRDNPNMTTTEIGKIMKLHSATISRYLKKGTILGWCNYDAKEEMNKRGYKAGKIKNKKIELYKDGVSMGVFESATELVRRAEDLFYVKFSNSLISQVANCQRKAHKGYTFKYIDNNINQAI